MPYAQLQSLRLYYEERGSGAPILLIHGTGGDADTWGPAVDQVAEHGRVITYDRRGCTRSERPDSSPLTLAADQTRDAAELLDALGAKPAIVIGRSYGGGLALSLARDYPGHVAALVLLEPASYGLVPDFERLIERAGDVLSKLPEEQAGEAFVKMMIGEDAWNSMPATWQQRRRDNSNATLAEVRGAPPILAAASLAAITQPVLIVGAETSPAPFRALNQKLAEALPNARQVLTDGGHLITPAEPRVLAFIDEATVRV